MNIFKNGVGRPSNNIKRARVIIAVIAVILSATIGYALFSQEVKVTGTATASGTFQITTTCQSGIPQNILTANGVSLSAYGDNGYENDTCNVNGNIVTMNTGLKYPGAQRIFIVKFKNTGTIDAKWSESTFEDSISESFCTINASTGANISCEDRTEMFEFSEMGVEDKNGVYADCYNFGDEAFYDNMLSSQESVWANSFADIDDENVVLNPGESIYIAVIFEYPESITNSTYPGLAEGTIKLKQTISADFVWEQAN